MQNRYLSAFHLSVSIHPAPCCQICIFFIFFQAAKYVASTALRNEPDLFDGCVKTITTPCPIAIARDEEDLRISFMLSVPYNIV